ncbi:MAG: hypothetical protein Q9219_003766 [cf. Caloplaca sp. 3 TL-2023]
MSAKVLPSDFPIHSFSSAKNLETFLECEHATAPGFHLKLAKKTSGIPTVTAAEAVETALCFGWIDGRANRFDEDWWLVRYTPRRPKSIWSKKNVSTVVRLLDQARMRPAGIAAVEAAKADGRWERAYAGPATIQMPNDFAAALASEPVAARFFEGINKTDRYSVLWRIETASPQGRSKRIRGLVEMLAEEKTLGRPAESDPKVVAKKAKPSKTLRKRGAVPAKFADGQTVHGVERGQPRRTGLRCRSQV